MIPFSGVTYFTAYYHFYGKIIKYINDFLSIIEDEFRKNDLNELFRYYLYRRVLEIDKYDKYQINKNNILRDTIDSYKSGNQLLDMLYGDKIESHLVNNLVNGLRTQVMTSSQIVLKINYELSKIKSIVDERSISYFSKTFDRLSNRVTNLLELKQAAGSIIKLEESGDTPDIKSFRRRINKILYSYLRTADSIHDFLIGQRTTPEFKKRDLIKTITFNVKKENDDSEANMNYLEILKDMSEKTIFSEKFVFDEDTENINLLELSKSMNSRSNFETNIMEQLNKFIYRIINLDNTKNKHIKKELLSVYRPGNIVLEKILMESKETMNTAQYVDKEQLITMEQTGNGDIFTENIDNLLFVIYNDDILEPTKTEERKGIIEKVKQFLGIDNVSLSVDFYSSSGTFFKIFTEVESDGGRNIFVRPNRVLAEIWDPATNKKVKNIKELVITQTIKTDLLDKQQYIPICDKNYKVTLDERNNNLFVKAGINIEHLGKNTEKELDIENIDRTKQFHPEVKRISDLITRTDDDSEICKLLYLKNSGDWGQATSAKENKTFLLTEDKLCSYYSVLTNTSTIYTIKRGNTYLTFLHKGNINMLWKDIFLLINQSLIDNDFYLFVENYVIIYFDAVDKFNQNFRYELRFNIDN
jgi:hypothetical protein